MMSKIKLNLKKEDGTVINTVQPTETYYIKINPQRTKRIKDIDDC
jgi:hypothetical protein